MIKLSKIRNEISLSRGMASSMGIHRFAEDSLSELDVDLDPITDKLKGRFKDASTSGYSREELPDLFAEIEKQGLSKKLYNKINEKLEYVANDGQYNLGMINDRRYRNDFIFYLVDTKAKNPGEHFVGQIKTTIKKKGYRYNLEKGFGLVAYEVHWSFVPKEMQGTGMGKRLYSLVFDYITSQNAVMYSDSMLFEGSSRMWRTYIPTIAEFFGIQINDVMLPCSADDVAKVDYKNAKKVDNVDGFIAMDNPPKMVRKMAYNTTGLSFFKGEFCVVEVDDTVNTKVTVGGTRDTALLPYYNAIQSYDSVKEIVKSFIDGDLRFKRRQRPIMAGKSISNLKCVFLTFDDAILCAKDVGGDVVIVAI